MKTFRQMRISEKLYEARKAKEAAAVPVSGDTRTKEDGHGIGQDVKPGIFPAGDCEKGS